MTLNITSGRHTLSQRSAPRHRKPRTGGCWIKVAAPSYAKLSQISDDSGWSVEHLLDVAVDLFVISSRNLKILKRIAESEVD